MVDFLDYSDISAEVKGAMCPGKLKLTDQHIIFKNNRTGKVDQVAASDLEIVNWQKHVGSWGLRLFLKNGTLHRYAGFKEGEQDKLAKFFSANYKKDMLEKELSLKGWNWGTARFNGSVLSFDVGTNTSFEVPLNNVSQCTTGKNEVTLEFHQNDDSAVSLMEMRFHIPSSELAGDTDPVDAFHQQVMNQASVINLSGDAITTFKEIQCLTPRGRYDVKVYPSFFQLHGKTFDYKIPMSTVLRLFILPHRDGRQMFFVVSLDPPIKQGQTRYHFLVFLFGQDEDISIEVSLTEDELREKYDGKLSKEMTGPTFEVMGKVMKSIIGRKITTPGGFVGHSTTPAVSCSYKATAGFLYPLERGFIYVHKPPVHIRFEEITSVNFARSGGGTRSFDFEVEIKSGVVHTFSSIEKDEYAKLFDFINSKKLRVKNRGKNDKTSFTDDFGDSDQEVEPDAYLARVKAEAEERDDDEDGGGESESTDEDFNPDQQDSGDVAEEFDSSPPDTDSDASGGSETGTGTGTGTGKKKEKKHKTAKTVSEKPRKRREKKVDDGRPKRPTTAFMIWMNATRDKIKADNPNISFTDIARKGGEMWKAMDDKSEWEAKAVKAKEEYAVKMKEYQASGGTAVPKEKKATKGSSTAVRKKSSPVKNNDTPQTNSPSKNPPNIGFKSKEYCSDVDSTSSDSDDAKKPTTVVKKEAPKAKSSSSDEEMDADGSSGSNSDTKIKKKKETPKKTTKEVKKSAKKDTSDEEMSAENDNSDSGKKKPVPKKGTKEVKKSAKKDTSDEEMSVDDDNSDSGKKKPVPKKATKEVKKTAKKDTSDEEMSVDDDNSYSGKKKPVPKKAASKKKKEMPKKKKESESDESGDASSDSESDKKKKSKKKPEPKKMAKGKDMKKKKQESEEEESAEETPATSDESGSD